ncbi:hypothetical protein C8J57DRAFT_1246579 [Mycena rebaudengoi]|nr:hypothetical protein C8J57DRAFT_1246579 [Mycena rebaudengoi]
MQLEQATVNSVLTYILQYPIQEMKMVKSPYGLGIEGYVRNGLAHITKSEVKFKFIDGEGLRAILVDGNKPQENALGAYLVTRNRLDTSGVHEMDPKLILLNIL